MRKFLRASPLFGFRMVFEDEELDEVGRRLRRWLQIASAALLLEWPTRFAFCFLCCSMTTDIAASLHDTSLAKM